MNIPLWLVLVLGGAIGVISAGMAWKQATPPAIKEKRFYVSAVAAGAGGPYFAYKSLNEKLFFIDVFVCIDLVNKDTVLSKINDYYGQLLIGDEWVILQRIPFSDNGQFYFVKQPIDKSMSINFIQKTLDEQIKNTNLKPGETITGILMFYLKDNDRKKYAPMKAKTIRLVIFDSLQRKGEYLIDITGADKGKKEDFGMGWLNELRFKVKETGIDLRKFDIVNNF